MPAVLTENSTITCAHQGSVQRRAGQGNLTVNGQKVLVLGDLVGAAISGCANPVAPPSGNKTCTATTAAIGGVSTKLRVGGKLVLLETINGLTDGTLGGAPQPWSVKSAGQTKLKAG
jgi:hypothetical protein